MGVLKFIGKLLLNTLVVAVIAGIVFLLTCAVLKMTPHDYYWQVFEPGIKFLFTKPAV